MLLSTKKKQKRTVDLLYSFSIDDFIEIEIVVPTSCLGSVFARFINRIDKGKIIE